MDFVGFLQRSVPREELPGHKPQGDYILVTTGGGGDGADLIHQVIHAYQQDPELMHRALIVLGPYMPVKKREKLIRKGSKIPISRSSSSTIAWKSSLLAQRVSLPWAATTPIAKFSLSTSRR